MKAVISSTYDDNYLFFLPIVTWCWNKLGVDVICFMPDFEWDSIEDKRFGVVAKYLTKQRCDFKTFVCQKHKEATYSQCARLYAACLDLLEDEVLITGDVDMCVFKIPPHYGGVSIFGSDLVPYGQIPICYISATTGDWRRFMNVGSSSYQECLDTELAHIEAQNFGGNYWSKDQEIAWQRITPNDIIIPANYISRARPGTQFAENRIDRDDVNWRSYMNENLVDAHLWRPGYTDGNFANIMELMTTMFPNDNFDWFVEYRNKYIEFL